jgi:hypothetical protein
MYLLDIAAVRVSAVLMEFYAHSVLWPGYIYFKHLVLAARWGSGSMRCALLYSFRPSTFIHLWKSGFPLKRGPASIRDGMADVVFL